MGQPFLGEIRMFSGNYAPEGWALCDGTMLPIARYQALYAVIGPTYGGDEQRSFALPDFRGRGPIGSGAGPAGAHIVGEMADTAAAGPSGGKPASPVLCVSFIICMGGDFPQRS
jgi:microcystin-dependent protein